MSDNAKISPSSLRQLAARLHARSGLNRYSAVEFLIALVLLLVVTPLVEDLSQAMLVESVLLTLVLGSAVLAVGADQQTFFIALALGGPAVILRWLSHFWPAEIPPEAFQLMGISFIIFILFRLLRFILRATVVNTEVMCAGIAIYLTLGLLWSFAFLLVDRNFQQAFAYSNRAESGPLTGFEALYFSYVTLTTVGYGDILPLSRAARMLAVLESLTGTLYLAVLVSRLVSMYAGKAGEE